MLMLEAMRMSMFLLTEGWDPAFAVVPMTADSQLRDNHRRLLS